jgi:hypothetical protein
MCPTGLIPIVPHLSAHGGDLTTESRTCFTWKGMWKFVPTSFEVMGMCHLSPNVWGKRKKGKEKHLCTYPAVKPIQSLLHGGPIPKRLWHKNEREQILSQQGIGIFLRRPAIKCKGMVPHPSGGTTMIAGAVALVQPYHTWNGNAGETFPRCRALGLMQQMHWAQQHFASYEQERGHYAASIAMIMVAGVLALVQQINPWKRRGISS